MTQTTNLPVRNLVGVVLDGKNTTIDIPAGNLEVATTDGVKHARLFLQADGTDGILFNLTDRPADRLTAAGVDALAELRKIETGYRVDHSQHFNENDEPCGIERSWQNRIARDLAQLLDVIGVPEVRS